MLLGYNDLINRFILVYHEHVLEPSAHSFAKQFSYICKTITHKAFPSELLILYFTFHVEGTVLTSHIQKSNYFSQAVTFCVGIYL